MAATTAFTHADVLVAMVEPTDPVVKAASKPSTLHEEDDTTDVGFGSASGDDESSSGAECSISTSVGKKCRFGITPLETIPATPTESAMSLRSPPGMSRSAMRQARDSVTPRSAMRQARDSMTPRSAMRQARDSLRGASRPCRFGVNSLVTVPPTPKTAGCASIGSPTKRAMMRHRCDTLMREGRDAFTPATRNSRDVLVGDSPAMPPAPVEEDVALTFGPCGNPMTPPQRAAKRRAAREALIAKAKNEGMPLRVRTSVVTTANGKSSGVLDPARPAKKTLVFGEFAPASAPHWNTNMPLKKAVSKFLLGQSSSSDAAPR